MCTCRRARRASRASVADNSAPGFATIAYDSTTGARLWVTRYNGPANSTDRANSVAVSPTGEQVFVTGYSASVILGYDYATVAYSGRPN